jgi:hypothetical protein
MQNLRDMQESNARFERENIKEINNMKLALVDELQSHQKQLDRYMFWTRSNAEEKAREKSTVDSICEKMASLVQQSSATATELKILKSLHFPQIRARQTAIKKAYTNTFSWIFNKTSTPFKSWLESGEGIFWVSGKAGSGKSTLMKYLCNNLATETCLQRWAGQKRLVTASYYFWHGGSAMEKSQEGLLQSLLFQLLNQCPELIPDVVPKRWQADNKFHYFPEPWSKEELADALRATLDQGKLPVRFCFFVDGLDEYSGEYQEIAIRDNDARVQADHYALTVILNDLARSEDVKVCVSSRPWNPFRKAFGHAKERTFILEQLTESDMDHYIKGELESDPRFVKLAQSNNNAMELVSEIRIKAEGVFLWVYLAVRSLLRGLSESDGISELRHRLRLLPPDLKDFFGLMLKSIDPVYLTLTCRLLSLARFTAPLPLIAFWCIMTELDDPNYALKAKIEPYPVDQIASTNDAAITCVNKWCRDLLEVRTTRKRTTERADLYDSSITFLHRTVTDFLADTDIQEFLHRNAGSDFREEISSCRVQLAQAKTLPFASLSPTERERFYAFASETMRTAKVFELRTGSTPMAILEELDTVGTHLTSHWSKEHWTQQIPVDSSGHHPSWVHVREQGQSNFLAFAVSHGLEIFVTEVLKQNRSLVCKGGRPLLEYALHPTFPNTSLWSNHCIISVEMIKILLAAGADANEYAAVLGDATVWQVLLHDCFHGRTDNMLAAVELFLNHGADPDCLVPIKQSKSSHLPIGNLTGSRETRMDMASGELVGQQTATVLDALTKCMPAGLASSLLAEARARKSTTAHYSQSGTGWLSWLWAR